jgi:hypothetical protein
MSLTVSPALIAQAEAGAVSRGAFLQAVAESLPRAWKIVDSLVRTKRADPAGLAEHAPAHMDDKTRSELLRLTASTAIRDAVEAEYGLRLAFRNCHAAAVFGPDERDQFRSWTSMEAQVLNQRPELVDC